MSNHPPEDRDAAVADTQSVATKYDIIRKLSAGGMGEVFLVRERQSGLNRAFKVLRADVRDPECAEKRFRREALAMRRLQHPNIIEVVDFGVLPTRAQFLVMEYVEGQDAQLAVDEHGPLALGDALEVLHCLAGALAYAHEEGIVHRDLKPSNVLLVPGRPQEARLIDFGLVRLITGEQLTKLTATEQILGTPRFMAPEQCLGKEATPAVDIYGLAGVAYHLLSGQAVFVAPTVLEAIAANIDRPPDRLSARCGELEIPADLDELLLACLRKNPDARPAAGEVQRDLAQILEHLRGSAASTERQSRASFADSPLEGVVGLSSLIWTEADLSLVGPTLDDEAHREALFNQISAMLISLAQVLCQREPSRDVIEERLHDVTELQGAIEEQELQLVLAESEGAEPVATQNEQQLADSPELSDLRSRLRVMQQDLYHRYRKLFETVMNHRDGENEEMVLSMYGDLERLIEQYLMVRSMVAGETTALR